MGLFKKKKKKSSEEYDGYSYQDEGTADESYDSYDEPSEYSKDDYAYSEEDVYGEYGETMSRRKKKKSGLGGLIAVVAVILVLALIFVGVTSVISPGKGACEVLSTPSHWFGVTYKEDRPGVVAKFAELVQKGIYPSPLY